MKASILACTLATLFATPTWAGCKVDSYQFYFGSDTSTTMHVSGGGRCKMTIVMGRNSGLESIAITQAAQHGAASTNGSVAYPEVYYTPARGFKGSDRFTFTAKGGGKRLQGASNVSVSVEAE